MQAEAQVKGLLKLQRLKILQFEFLMLKLQMDSGGVLVGFSFLSTKILSSKIKYQFGSVCTDPNGEIKWPLLDLLEIC